VTGVAAAVAAEVAEPAADVTAEVAEPAAEVAGVATEATGLVPGEVAACAWRENTSKMTSIPAARIATCTARRATYRKTGCNISSSRTARTDQTRFHLPAMSGPKHTDRT